MLYFPTKTEGLYSKAYIEAFSWSFGSFVSNFTDLSSLSDTVLPTILLKPYIAFSSLFLCTSRFDFAKESYALGETSGDPGGLPYRWIIKAMIPLSFFFMAVSGIGLLLHSINKIVNPHLIYAGNNGKS